ncbi:hypothetical protein LPW11_07735 [Geomonas sp. RF6]|uniref:hypothetical protein n=1 Tax=Geomonas sp. RF6 TaxID=2897342 RepID=UPI001E3E8DF5|nr:hypothetical protein [Geomonas sp. RF6]UFS72073.1 hypothetical protein LPW11_07735 [Geomonas sp. RF6]
MDISPEQMEILGRARFVQRVAEMLVASGAVAPDNDPKVLCTHVANALDEAEARGIKSERLMGMYAILRLGDGVDPYAIKEYAAVLQDPSIAEDDKAHLLQMIRIGEL